MQQDRQANPDGPLLDCLEERHEDESFFLRQAFKLHRDPDGGEDFCSHLPAVDLSDALRRARKMKDRGLTHEAELEGLEDQREAQKDEVRSYGLPALAACQWDGGLEGRVGRSSWRCVRLQVDECFRLGRAIPVLGWFR